MNFRRPELWIALAFVLAILIGCLVFGYIQYNNQQVKSAPVYELSTQLFQSTTGTITPVEAISSTGTSVPPTVLAVFPTATPTPPIIWTVTWVGMEIDKYSGHSRLMATFSSDGGSIQLECHDPELNRPPLGTKYIKSGDIYIPTDTDQVYQRFVDVQN
jgi:hypothetical protein